jgi:hypothetical protein
MRWQSMAELRTDIDILTPEDIHLSDLPNINLVEINHDQLRP